MPSLLSFLVNVVCQVEKAAIGKSDNAQDLLSDVSFQAIAGIQAIEGQ